MYATIWGFWRQPSKIWLLLHEFLNENEPVPNRAHLALARLEALGIVRAVITQNVDNLHQDAGSRRVIEYHGNLMSVGVRTPERRFSYTGCILCSWLTACLLRV